MSSLGAAIAPVIPYLGTFLAYLCRTTAFLHTAPFVSERVVPRKARLAFAILFAAAMTGVRGEASLATIPGIAAAELLLGAACGLALRFGVAAIEAGGDLIGLHVGIGFAATVDPLNGEQSMPTAKLAFAIAGLAFFATGGPTSAIRVLAAPPPGISPTAGMARVLIDHSATILPHAVRLAAPVIVASVVGNVALALASRAAPALNIFSVAFSGILILGGIALLLSVPMFGAEIHAALQRGEDLIARVVGSL
ncbi:MAG: flagellar biosynthetic protein FliR [Pseudomonadota bacterium]